MQVETLRSWSHALLWLSILLPVLGGLAATARFYVERAERRILNAAVQEELASLRQRTVRRTIPNPDRLVADLAQKDRIQTYMYIDGYDAEVSEFAQDLRLALGRAGFLVSSTSQHLPQLPAGVTVFLDSTPPAPPYVAQVRAAFQSSGLAPLTFLTDKSRLPQGVSTPNNERLLVMVGRRP
jgi:hypothetical protein